jgi:hypothetical protein
MKNKLKIMAEYQSLGIWSLDQKINVEEVFESLSDELKLYMSLWIECYNAQIDWSDPKNEEWDAQNNQNYIEAYRALEKLVFEKVKNEIGDIYDLTIVPSMSEES